MYKRVYKVFVLVVTSLFFVSCTNKEVRPLQVETRVQANKKVFLEEDIYILFALRAEKLGKYATASEFFMELFQKSHKKEYLYKAVSNYISAQNYPKIIEVVDSMNKDTLADVKLTRFKILALLKLGKIERAEKLASRLVRLSDKTNDYLLLGDIYIKQEKYDVALKYLESAYVKNYNELILDKISVIMYMNLHRKKDAIAGLETHSRIKGCGEIICHRLIGFYSKENNIDGILSTYLRMYKESKDEEISKKIIQIYGYKKDYIKMIDFLEVAQTDDEILLQLYAVTKNYAKAFPLAQKLYKSSLNSVYLGQSAIYEYESTKKKDDTKVLQSVVSKLEEVVKKNHDPLYENYLGYVLIDHDIDVKKGMKHIQNVLKVQPDSAYYLDSLAWGYYKLKECTKANTIMNRVVKLEGGEDKEVLEHVKAIQNCIKIKGKK